MSSRAAKKRKQRAEGIHTLKEAFAPLTALMFRQMDEREAQYAKNPLIAKLRAIPTIPGPALGRRLDSPMHIAFDSFDDPRWF